MSTIKSYTDLSQSKKLAEILPIESSDMYWDLLSKDKYAKVNNIGHCLCRTCVYAWSLAALLNVLPEIHGGKPVIALDDNYITYPHMNNLYTKAESLVDACMAMIEKLNEQNLL